MTSAKTALADTKRRPIPAAPDRRRRRRAGRARRRRRSRRPPRARGGARRPSAAGSSSRAPSASRRSASACWAASTRRLELVEVDAAIGVGVGRLEVGTVERAGAGEQPAQRRRPPRAGRRDRARLRSVGGLEDEAQARGAAPARVRRGGRERPLGQLGRDAGIAADPHQVERATGRGRAAARGARRRRRRWRRARRRRRRRRSPGRAARAAQASRRGSAVARGERDGSAQPLAGSTRAAASSTIATRWVIAVPVRGVRTNSSCGGGARPPAMSSSVAARARLPRASWYTLSAVTASAAASTAASSHAEHAHQRSSRRGSSAVEPLDLGEHGVGARRSTCPCSTSPSSCVRPATASSPSSPGRRGDAAQVVDELVEPTPRAGAARRRSRAATPSGMPWRTPSNSRSARRTRSDVSLIGVGAVARRRRGRGAPRAAAPPCSPGRATGRG